MKDRCGLNKKIGLVIVGILLLDQLTKLLVEDRMLLGESIPMIPAFFHITYVMNYGAAFGLFPHQQWFFVLAAVVMIALGYWGILKLRHYGVFFIYGTSLMMAGALGNLLDRIRLDGVVDFFDFRIWPIFNVADIAICAGVGLILLAMFKEQGEPHA